MEVEAGESIEIDINKFKEKILSSEQSSEADENELQVETRDDVLDKFIEILLRNNFMSDIIFQVNRSDTIGEVKKKIFETEGIALSHRQIRLIFCGKELQNEWRILDYDIQNFSVVHLVLPMHPK